MIALDAAGSFDEALHQEIENNRRLELSDAEFKKQNSAAFNKLKIEPRFHHSLCFMCAARVRLS